MTPTPGRSRCRRALLLDRHRQARGGRLDIGRCLPWKGPVRFANLRSLLGVSVSGRIDNGVATIALTAWQDCTVRVGGNDIALKKGQSRTVTLNAGG